MCLVCVLSVLSVCVFVRSKGGLATRTYARVNVHRGRVFIPTVAALHLRDLSHPLPSSLLISMLRMARDHKFTTASGATIDRDEVTHWFAKERAPRAYAHVIADIVVRANLLDVLQVALDLQRVLGLHAVRLVLAVAVRRTSYHGGGERSTDPHDQRTYAPGSGAIYLLLHYDLEGDGENEQFP